MRHRIFATWKVTPVLCLLAICASSTVADAPVATDGAPAIPALPITEETPEFGVLTIAAGVETTYYACTACHSERIVAQQGLSRDAWDGVLDWMVEEQGMSEIAEPDRTTILDYLATHYNQDRPNYPEPIDK